MKLVVFLFLHLLKLSNSYSPYVYDIPSGPGIYVWQIPENKEPEKLEYSPNAEFRHRKTYIFTWLRCNLQCHIIYWVGEKSKMAARERTAIHVGFVWDAVKNLKFCLHISITRETYSEETKTFQTLLQSSPQKLPRLYKIVPGLLPERFIVQVPLNIEEIISYFSFVFEEKSLVTVWHGKNSNSFKRSMSESFAKFIIQEDEKPILIIDKELKEVKKLILTPTGEFSENVLVEQKKQESPNNSKKKVRTQKEGSHVISASSSNSKTERILDSDKAREKLDTAFNLHEEEFFHKIPDRTDEKEIERRNKPENSSEWEKKGRWIRPGVFKYYFNPLTENVCFVRNPKIMENSKYLSTEHAYVIKHYFPYELFVYIGKNADIPIIQHALKDVESALLNMSLFQAWKKITVVQEEIAPPLHFRIIFSDKNQVLLKLLEKLYLTT